MRTDSKSPISNLESLGEVVIATHVTTSQPDWRRTRTIILLLAASVALMMTGFGIIMPIFARRLGEFGDGVEALGYMTMAFALTQLIASPFMGSFADKFGRRPLVLVALAAFTLTNIGYLLAPSTAVFILVRALGGAFTAGLFPAAMGVVADIVPEENRAQWIGVVMGGYGVGFIFGPVIGGVLYDSLGFAAPFTVSAILAFMALIAASILVPETRTKEVRWRDTLRRRREAAMAATKNKSLWATLPRPLYVFATLLFLDFIGSFAFAFVEPQMVFYMYEQLNWTTAQFGLVVGAYGLAMVFGQMGLGQLSDRYGRKPLIITGILLNSALYIGMATVQSYAVMMLVSVVAGLGSALIAPAISAFYLDITAEQYRSRVVGIKESALALGGVVGPLSVAVAAGLTTPRGVFTIAGGLTLFGMVLAIALLHQPGQETAETDDPEWEISGKRAMCAQASLRGLVLNASTARARRQVVTAVSLLFIASVIR